MLFAVQLGPFVSGLDEGLGSGGLLGKEEAARGGRRVAGLAAALGNVTLLAFEFLLNGREDSLAVFTEAFAERIGTSCSELLLFVSTSFLDGLMALGSSSEASTIVQTSTGLLDVTGLQLELLLEFTEEVVTVFADQLAGLGGLASLLCA